MACVVLAAALLVASRFTQPPVNEYLLMGAVAFSTIPVGLAINTWARRQRTVRREDSPDSVEHRAAHQARSQTFGDALVLGALLLLGLSLAPGPVPALWALGFMLALVAAFWLRYLVTLRSMRG
ncbi:MAG: hypothetical protein Q4F65_04340 [Propionibacteriaceae bacterium]|nr:hypothetical protein [Propionibacteriaceae bacterium]